MDAPNNDSGKATSEKREKSPDHVLQLVEDHADRHPGQDYWIQTETHAGELLLAIAAVVRSTAKGVSDKHDRKLMQNFANEYVQAVQDSRALEYIRGLTEEDELELYGCKLRAQTVVLQ